MRQIQLIFLLTILFLISCHTDKKKALIGNDDTHQFPVVLDTFGIDSFFHYLNNDSPTWLSTSNYNFYYIGKVEDTFYLNPFINFSYPPLPPTLYTDTKKINRTKSPKHENPFKKYYVDWDKEISYKYWTKAKIDIRIDTAFHKHSFLPIMLTNVDTEKIIIGYGRHIPIVMEATDSLGHWQPIQEIFSYMCGVGVGSIILPPKECVLTLTPIFKGSYKTKLRLVIGDNQSKAFLGYINYSQFQNK